MTFNRKAKPEGSVSFDGGLTPDAPEAGPRRLRLSPTFQAGPGDRGR